MKKTMLLCVAFAIAGVIAGWTTCQKVENRDPYTGASYREIANERLQMIIAQSNLLHMIYAEDPDYWNDVVVETEEYYELDSVREGDWEDFYLY